MKPLRVIPVALTARAVLLALLALIASGFLAPHQASAQGTVNFDIDPETTGNSADTLGYVENCYWIASAPTSFDGVADYVIDIVVRGDTQAPVDYEVSLNYDNTVIHIVPPDTDPLIKMPGAYDLSDTLPDDDGTFACGAFYVGPSGIPGDGIICRLGLDINGLYSPSYAALTLSAPPLTSYESLSGNHPVTVDGAHLVINDTCGPDEVDLSVDSEVTSAPTDLLVSEDATLSVSTTGTHTGWPLPNTVEVAISHTVTAPAGCTVNGSASASDSWTGDLDGGASHLLATDFTIQCSQPSTHVFVVDSEIELLTVGYLCDPNPLNDTDTENVSVNVWLFGDDDHDGFTTAVEEYVGTDPLDACPDDPSDDAWPLDNNVDTFVTVGGDILLYRGRIGATGGPPADPEWLQRLDLNMDNYITTGGDVLPYRGMTGESCTNL